MSLSKTPGGLELDQPPGGLEGAKSPDQTPGGVETGQMKMVLRGQDAKAKGFLYLRRLLSYFQ